MLRIRGVPSGSPAWRARVAQAAAEATLLAAPGLVLRFTLRPRQFVDLDTLVEATAAGLRDAGVYARGLAGLDVVVATVSRRGEPGLRTTSGRSEPLRRLGPPGPARLDLAADELPGTTRPGKRRWRAAIAHAWEGPMLAEGLVWAEVSLQRPGSILAPIEPVLDALEPVLGRDARGRDSQEFFPADDRITWLRVLRAAHLDDPVLRLRLGVVEPGAATRRFAGG